MNDNTSTSSTSSLEATETHALDVLALIQMYLADTRGAGSLHPHNPDMAQRLAIRITAHMETLASTVNDTAPTLSALLLELSKFIEDDLSWLKVERENAQRLKMTNGQQLTQ